LVLSLDEIRRGFRTFGTWQEVHGLAERSDLHAIGQQLMEFDALALVEAGSRFNAILNHRDFRDSAPVALFRPLISPDLRVAIRSAVDRGVSADGIVNRQQLLTFMKLALTNGQLGTGRRIQSEAEDHILGEILLKLNDHLLPDLNDALVGDERRRSLLALLVLHGILSHTPYVPGAIARNLRMLEIHDSLGGRPEWFDVRGEFQRATGLTIDSYIHHVFAVWAFVDAMTPALMAGNPQAIANHPETALHNTGVNVDEFKAALRQISLRPDEFRARLIAGPPRPPYFDFVSFQDYPVIEFPPGFFWPIDPGFLIDKLGEGVFWLLHRPDPALSAGANTQRNFRLRQWWGRLFEEYIDLLMRNFYAASGRYARIPEGAGAGARCDAVLDSGPSLVLFEFKASYLRTDAKLSAASDILLADIQQKFAAGGGQGEAAKGVRQLAHMCVHVQRTGEVPGVGAFPGVRLFPALVAMDNALASLEVGWHLNALFRTALVELGGDPSRVAPLTVLTGEDLEKVLPYTSERSLVELLQLYHDEDPDLHTSFRFVMSRRVYRSPGLRNQWIEDRADLWKDDLLDRYFPRRGDGAIT